MRRPEFTPTENALIQQMLHLSPRGASAFPALYLISALLIVLVDGLGGDVGPGMFIALFLVICCRLYEEQQHRRYGGLWKSIFQKYEAAFATEEFDATLTAEQPGGQAPDPSHG